MDHFPPLFPPRRAANDTIVAPVVDLLAYRLQADLEACFRSHVMIEPFWGEFTVSPFPLELSFNWCSHACQFCFANLNTPDRTFNPQQVMRLLAEYRDRTSVGARLLAEGYPVLVSNRTDAFAKSNYKQSVPILRTMIDLGIPLAFQTRGGDGIDDVLSALPPSYWYVSICSLSDEVRARVEPGAPTIASRFELITKLREAGHVVVLGLNPLVPDWLPEGPGPLLARAAEAGAQGVWTETLHLSQRQVQRIDGRGRAALTLPLIERSSGRREDPAAHAFWCRARHEAEDMGLPVFSVGQSDPSEFWLPAQALYERLFPVVQDFVNLAWAECKHGDVLSYDSFRDVMLPDLPFPGERLNIPHYIGAKNHDILTDNRYPAKMTYEEVLRAVWCEGRLSFCPARMEAFAFAGRQVEVGRRVEWQGVEEPRDDGTRMPYLVFTDAEGGFPAYFTDEWEVGDNAPPSARRPSSPSLDASSSPDEPDDGPGGEQVDLFSALGGELAMAFSLDAAGADGAGVEA